MILLAILTKIYQKCNPIFILKQEIFIIFFFWRRNVHLNNFQMNGLEINQRQRHVLNPP